MRNRIHILWIVFLFHIFCCDYSSTVLHTDADVRDPQFRRTPLHEAVIANNVDEVRRLLGAGEKPYVKDDCWRTPIHYVCAKKNINKVIAGLLLTHLIDMRMMGIDYRAVIDSYDLDGKAAMHLAAQNGDKEVVIMLRKHGGSVDLGDEFDNFTPMHYATAGGFVELVEELSQYSAWKEAETYAKRPLDLALENDHYSFVGSDIESMYYWPADHVIHKRTDLKFHSDPENEKRYKRLKAKLDEIFKRRIWY